MIKLLNILWPIIIIISIIFAIISGNMEKLNSSIFESCGTAIQLSISLLGTICLWNGIMQIVQDSSLIKKITKLLQPIFRFLFPDIKEGSKENKEISLNIIANILGLGNAATPLGLKAMKTMQEKNSNKDTLTNSMAMFIILNTASLQLIPTTVIAIRNSLGSQNPTSIIVPVWISTICAGIAGITLAKIFIRKSKTKN